MLNHRYDIAALVCRCTLGLVLLAHRLLKIFVFTFAGTAGFFESVGFPGWAAYLVAPLEVAAGALLIIGFQTRVAALVTLPILIGALVVHSGNGWLFSSPNGGWEFPAVLIMMALGVALLGGGTYGLQQTKVNP